jgi:hypothetical protein
MRTISTAWGDWLGERDWHHFITLTFKYEASIAHAEGQLKRWIRKVQQRAQHDVEWFCAGEYGSGGLVHLHALTAGTEKLTGQALVESWPVGRAQAHVYDRSRGAARYITKGFDYEDAYYDFHFAD